VKRALAPLLAVWLASPAAAAPVLAALAPAADARAAVAIGPSGEVYRPDGQGAWVRTLPSIIADRVAQVGTAGRDVLALADGTVYRLAPNGWSALRLVQKGKAVMSGGTRAVAAVGRQLFALERVSGAEQAKLATAPANVLAIGAGTGDAWVIATDRGLYRYDGRGFKQLPRAPRQVDRLVGDRWALVDGTLVELATGKRAQLPAGLVVRVAAVGPEGPIALGADPSGLTLVTIKTRKAGKAATVDTAPLPETLRNTIPVAIIADDQGRVLVAFQDGRLALLDRGAWIEATAQEALPAARPGSPPATESARNKPKPQLGNR
jgi:hypothetical protein